jgi:hypothetical protein
MFWSFEPLSSSFWNKQPSHLTAHDGASESPCVKDSRPSWLNDHSWIICQAHTCLVWTAIVQQRSQVDRESGRYPNGRGFSQSLTFQGNFRSPLPSFPKMVVRGFFCRVPGGGPSASAGWIPSTAGRMPVTSGHESELPLNLAPIKKGDDDGQRKCSASDTR